MVFRFGTLDDRFRRLNDGDLTMDMNEEGEMSIEGLPPRPMVPMGPQRIAVGQQIEHAILNQMDRWVDPWATWTL